MNKIETDFDKLKHYEDIETYYSSLNDIKDFLYELFGDRVESQKYIVRANKKIEQLQSNWNSLRDWLEEYLEKNEKWFKQELSDHDKEYYKETYNVAGYILDKILDKMNELEGVDNENNRLS